MGKSSRAAAAPEIAMSHNVDHIRGDRQLQCDVLVALAECRNHRKWFAGFAKPFLGEHPIEIGSGLGDYALEWIPSVEKYTATEADPALFAELKKHMAVYPSVTVRQMLLPTEERGDHSCLVCYNVLEHIVDHVGALQSMARLVRPDGYIVLVSAAFPFAMSPVDIATGTVRRYTKRSMRKALTDAGLEAVDVRYANSLGLICYYAITSLLKKQPSTGWTMSFYDRLVVPVVRMLERVIAGRPPFGQSVVAIARVKPDSEEREFDENHVGAERDRPQVRVEPRGSRQPNNIFSPIGRIPATTDSEEKLSRDAWRQFLTTRHLCDIVEGTVLAVGPIAITIQLADKVTGIILTRDFSTDQVPAIGDVVPVCLLYIDEDHLFIMLSTESTEFYERIPELHDSALTNLLNIAGESWNAKKSSSGYSAVDKASLATRWRILQGILASTCMLWPPSVAAVWLTSKNSYLVGARPIDVLASDGPRAVIDALDAAAAGAYS
jgi:ubiquinone/menaquinone biosynthesis C-methylase UbiE